MSTTRAAIPNFDDDEDDVLAPKEPQVTSADPEERKMARSLRIKRRKEALKKAEQPPEEQALEEEVGSIEQATAAAAEELQRLALEGSAMVTNVKVTTDEREVERRNTRFDLMNDLTGKIEEEAAETQLQYEAISVNWDAMLAVKDPLDIDEAMNKQKKKCDELLEQKNTLIETLKGVLHDMDNAYFVDLDKQDKDIKELSDRVEKQITIMQRAYEKQLNMIELAINAEREALIEHNNKRWEALYKQRDKEELQHIDATFRQLEGNKKELEKIMWDHHEKYREAKIELETLLQELQKELEKLKATCLINTEKIGYNLQVLKKREEENVFVRSQQKRKLNKMADVANELRSKIRKAADDGVLEEIRANAEITKLMEAMDELEKKSDQFSSVNNNRFEQVWRMSQGRCVQTYHQIRSAEVAIHAHILSEPAPPPPQPPPKSPFETATGTSEKVKRTAMTAQLQEKEEEENIIKSRDKLVRHILEIVANNTGFLVEDRLLTLVQKFQLTSRNLCTLDAIFMALEIGAAEDIELLCQVFLKYAFCPICVGLDEQMSSYLEQQSVSQAETAAAKPKAPSMRPRTSTARSLSVSTSKCMHPAALRQDLTPEDQLLMAEADEIVLKCGDPQAPPHVTGVSEERPTAQRRQGRGVTVATTQDVASEGMVNPYLCPAGHHLEIEPMQVLTALSEFISVFEPPEKKKLYEILNSLKPPNFSTFSRNLTPESIEQYWEQWRNIYSSDKDRFWDGLLAGLSNFLAVLKERDKINDEVILLRQRNASLRNLVRGTLPAIPSVQRPRYLNESLPGVNAPPPDPNPTAYARFPLLPPNKNNMCGMPKRNM